MLHLGPAMVRYLAVVYGRQQRGVCWMVIQRCWILSLEWSLPVSNTKTGRPELSIKLGKYVLSNQTIEFDGICSKVSGLLTLLSNRVASIDCRISWFSGIRPENLSGAYAPFLGT
jgi:hypothetical protein